MLFTHWRADYSSVLQLVANESYDGARGQQCLGRHCPKKGGQRRMGVLPVHILVSPSRFGGERTPLV